LKWCVYGKNQQQQQHPKTKQTNKTPRNKQNPKKQTTLFAVVIGIRLILQESNKSRAAYPNNFHYL